MEAREFQNIALELVDGTTAAQFRTAISRAYYATYHVGIEILEEMGFRIPKGSGGHEEVRRLFNNSGDREITKVASQLGDLYGKRIQADYRLTRTDVENQNTARALVKQANKMIEALGGCSDVGRRTQMINSIREWKRATSGGWR